MKDLAIEAARESGKLMLEWRNKFPPGPAKMDYKGAKDVVTEVDHRSEEMIINRIRSRYPEHNILGEEGGLQNGTGNSPYTWVIDPLDGTANYAADLAASCVSIGVLEGKQPVLGVVYNPFRDELFVAEKGKGAFLNDYRIQVSQVKDLEKALVSFDIGYNEGKALEQLRLAVFLRPHVRSMRVIGSAVLALCYVACGRFDLFYHRGLHPWDLAAATLVIEEAGGLVTDGHGNPTDIYNPAIVTANPELHRIFLKTVSQME